MNEVLDLTLRGGNVLRYHTFPHAHRHQSVAEHSFRAYMVAMHLTDGQVPINVIHEILHHDVAEAVTGDTPHTAKQYYHDLNYTLDNAERGIRSDNDITFDLTPVEKKFVKLCDMLEMGLYAVEQIQCGNLKYKMIAKNVVTWCTNHSDHFVDDQEAIDLIQQIKLEAR